MLKELIHNFKVTEYCKFITSRELNKGAKVCGVDLKEDFLNFKLYTELLEIPSEEITEEFLGTRLAEEFYKWSSFWDKSRESGLAFGLKLDSNNVSKKYFHVKFKPCFDQVLYKEQFFFLKLLNINVTSLLKGISYEIESGDNFYSKFYVYVKNPIDIKKVLMYKKMLYNLNIDEIDELELYATEKTFKINIVNKTNNFVAKQDVWQTIPDAHKQSLKDCSVVLDCEPTYTGITTAGVVSAYFSFTKKSNNILNL
jgi:hypothetical protein